jgi:uncharacterized protein YbjT (DUF2867 family)
MTKILVTGATGFIGKRLINALLENTHEVYALVRIKGTAPFPSDLPNLHLITGDLRNAEGLDELPDGVSAAYYLMHSMGENEKGFSETEKIVAQNFSRAANKKGIKQIIYLSGISNQENLSKHLKSRLAVENILKDSGIPTTILRASIIVGSGSASFEIIRDLAEKLPIMLAPKWVNTLCQPIAIRDVLFYLQEVIGHPDCLNRTFDIGGPDILTFKKALLQYAEVRELRRYIVTVPVLTPHLSSYWLVFITSVRFSLAYSLVESMKTDTVCLDHAIQQIIPHTCLNYREAIKQALYQTANQDVPSTWMDAWDVHHTNPDIQQYSQIPDQGILRDSQRVPIHGTIEDVIGRIWSIGGANGWYSLKWAWELRGLFDKLIGGVGLNRGRRHPTELQAGDAVDFWRVLKADKQEKHLILFAQMKLPGEAWIEFKIEEDKSGPYLKQTATFLPRGLLGRLYWYAMLPFHLIIFKKMAQSIANGPS